MINKIFFIVLSFVPVILNAQQDEQMSLYMQNQLYYNPAYAGSRNALSITAIGRFQWINFKGAPQSQWFSIHAPFWERRIGAGLHAVNDRIGDRSRTAVYADLNGSIPLNDRSLRLAIGLSGGVDIITNDFTNTYAIDPNDPLATAVFSATKPNMGAGVYLSSDRFFVGLSSPRVMESKASFSNFSTGKLNTRHFFLSGGYVFDLNSSFKLKPTALLKYTQNAPLTVDANVSLLMYDQFWIGVMYRFHEAMGVNAIFNINKTFAVGYAYDFPINGLRTYQSGSHEIFLRCDLVPKKQSYTSPRYF